MVNRQLIWFLLSVWTLFVLINFDIMYFISNTSMILYIILIPGYIGSLDTFILISGNWNGWTIKKIMGNSFLFFITNSLTSKGLNTNIIVSSTRVKAIAVVEIITDNNNIKLTVNNTSVKIIKEDLTVLGINNEIVSYYTGKKLSK